MKSLTGRVATPNAGRYLQQLCRHWTHELDVEFDETDGLVRFGEGTARLAAGADVLAISLEAHDDATLEKLRDVVVRHLDRFAFREAPLPYRWASTD